MPADGIEDWGSWEKTRELQLRGWLSATAAQRLQWLEEALVIAWRAGALRDRLGR